MFYCTLSTAETEKYLVTEDIQIFAIIRTYVAISGDKKEQYEKRL